MPDTPPPTSKELDEALLIFWQDLNNAGFDMLPGTTTRAKERLTRCIEAEKVRARIQEIKLYQEKRYKPSVRIARLEAELQQRLPEGEQT